MCLMAEEKSEASFSDPEGNDSCASEYRWLISDRPGR